MINATDRELPFREKIVDHPNKMATIIPHSKNIVFSLRKVMQQMDHHSRSLDKQYGITGPQLVCLYEIYEKGVLTISRLSKHVHLSLSTLVGIIDRLEEKGFVMRKRDTQDRRAIFIDITNKGKTFVSTSPHLLHNQLDEQFKLISETDQALIANSLALLVKMLSND